MAFVNEFVSPEDFEKFGFKELNRKLRMMDEETNWTVDKERDIYIRRISQLGPSYGYEHFHMYWHGALFKVFIIYGDNHLRSLKGMELPKELEQHKSDIIDDLKEALKVMGDGGVFSIAHNIQVTFDF